MQQYPLRGVRGWGTELKSAGEVGGGQEKQGRAREAREKEMSWTMVEIHEALSSYPSEAAAGGGPTEGLSLQAGSWEREDLEGKVNCSHDCWLLSP